MVSHAELSTRKANWDLLRGLSMFFVVMVHTSAYFPQIISNFNLGNAICRVAVICDPVFFILSGYFALRPLKGSLRDYYLKKVVSIIFPIVLYSIVVYVATCYREGSSIGLGGYCSYALKTVQGGWWFIPALIPFLVFAPFLFRAFEALDDEKVLKLFTVLSAMYIWGDSYHVLTYVLLMLDRPGATNLLSFVSLLFPRTPPAGYFSVFVLGYFYRRLSDIWSVRQKNLMIAIGILAIFVCFLFAGIGMGEDDPNQLWVIAAFGLFFLFERVSVANYLNRFVVWIGKRSFTIYLFQYMTIDITHAWFYEQMPFGDPALLAPATGLLVWLLLTVASYALALLIASILDSILLNPLQRVVTKAIAKVRHQELLS